MRKKIPSCNNSALKVRFFLRLLFEWWNWYLNSGCEACNSDREHKEHKKDRKRVKKAEQQKRKKVTINSDTEGKKNRNRPPMPKTENIGS